jgi:hypothetical protein
MNHTTSNIRPSLLDIQNSDQKSKNHESTLSLIVTRFIKALKSYRTISKSTYRHKSFIQENLLDENLGPEIHRIFR